MIVITVLFKLIVCLDSISTIKLSLRGPIDSVVVGGGGEWELTQNCGRKYPKSEVYFNRTTF